jgi:biopolymer transport protein ExbB
VELLKQSLDYFIFGILGLMSFLMLWFVVERYLFYRRIRLQDYSHADDLQVALTNRLTAIASIGANAPYIGLLGTVLGILITFYDLGQGGRIEPNTIMLGLALALKATAMGLVVAIPAILFYNALLRKVDVLTARWKQLRRQ